MHNIDIEKETIQHESVQQVNSKKLPKNINNLINDRIAKSMHSKKMENNPNFQISLNRDVKKLLIQTDTTEKPQNTNLLKIHDGLSNIQNQFSDKPETISGMANQISISQNEMNDANIAILYSLVKNNPNSMALLNKYQHQLYMLEEMPDSQEKKNSINQLIQLLLIYQAGTDPTVNNAVDFGNKLTDLMTDFGLNPNQLFKSQEKLATTLSKQGKINTSLTNINQGISRLDIGERLKDLFTHLRNLKNTHLTRAFNQTFLLAAWIITAFTVFGVLTERKKYK
ncbi:hypothetical protein [Companilactobacillus metriopterae]|uniref:hypothetical protein n=1 Tax=Companilactobacillus metriopterae TaxID=1909267 RepID=UPI0013E9771D|nr:hypothetical protein [Companilactobacillus metriopterae]